MAGTVTSFTDLKARIAAILGRAGLNEVQAQAVAGFVAAGERDGAKAHGVYRIEGLLKTIKAGKVNPNAVPELLPDDGSAVIRVAAGDGFSPPAFALGLPHLIERAKSLGLAALVVNDCAHFSALWPEVEPLAEAGLAGLAMCPSYATVAPAGGRAPLLGTNPLAFAWPRLGGDPFVFDIATSVAARGEIELKRRAGETLPEGWAIDAAGQPTTDPEAALAGAMLSFGGYKGSAIGTMIELLAGIMIGDLTSRGALDKLGTTTLAPSHGELIIAFAPDHFAKGRPGDPLARGEALFDAILGQGARLPSQRRFDARGKAAKEGIPLTEAEEAMLVRFLAQGLDAVG